MRFASVVAYLLLSTCVKQIACVDDRSSRETMVGTEQSLRLFFPAALTRLAEAMQRPNHYRQASLIMLPCARFYHFIARLYQFTIDYKQPSREVYERLMRRALKEPEVRSSPSYVALIEVCLEINKVPDLDPLTSDKFVPKNCEGIRAKHLKDVESFEKTFKNFKRISINEQKYIWRRHSRRTHIILNSGSVVKQAALKFRQTMEASISSLLNKVTNQDDLKLLTEVDARIANLDWQTFID